MDCLVSSNRKWLTGWRKANTSTLSHASPSTDALQTSGGPWPPGSPSTACTPPTCSGWSRSLASSEPPVHHYDYGIMHKCIYGWVWLWRLDYCEGFEGWGWVSWLGGSGPAGGPVWPTRPTGGVLQQQALIWNWVNYGSLWKSIKLTYNILLCFFPIVSVSIGCKLDINTC